MKTKKAPKMSGLVVAALRNLRNAQGSTARQIMKYIMAEYNASEATVQRQLRTALKRGVEYGVLKKTHNGYSLHTDADVIGPLDFAQMEACGKRRRRNPCPRPKRRCPKKKKRCPKRRPRRNPCNTCAARGRTGNCNQPPIQLVHEDTPGRDDNTNINESETDKRSIEEDEQEQDQEQQRNRSRSNSRGTAPRHRSRSQSNVRSKYSESDMDDDQ